MSAEHLICPCCGFPYLPVVEGVTFCRIAGFPAYAVGDDGGIWTAKNTGVSWREMKPGVVHDHLSVGLTWRHKRKTQYVHRLVLEAFVGPCPPGMECRHLDGNPRNNRLGNLAWGTPAENAADSLRHGVTPMGDTHGSSVLTEMQVRDILQALANGESAIVLSRRYQVSATHIHRINNGDAWGHIPSPNGKRPVATLPRAMRKKGFKLQLTDEQRKARSEQAKRIGLSYLGRAAKATKTVSQDERT